MWFDIRVLSLAILCVNLTTLTACNKKCVLLDAVEYLDTAQHEDELYYLYSRTYGFQEKQTIFELYKGKPQLDDCREANIKPVAVVPHYHEKYVSEIVFQPESEGLLRISFTSDINQGYANTDDVRFK